MTEAIDETPMEREEAQAITRREGSEGARWLLRKNKNAVLSTLSKRHGGWPFGSVAPYALDARGEPLLYVSAIAEHTKNMRADPRVSLLVEEGAGDGDQQAHARLTLLGRAEPVEAAEVPDVRARYLARFPSAAGYEDMHDFSLFRIRTEHARFIGGFGRIFWLAAGEIRFDPAADPLARTAEGILDHMNRDHVDALLLYCQAFKSVSPARARMVGVDQWGFDVLCESPDLRLRFDFDAPATPETIRAQVVDLVREARARLARPGA